MVFTCLDVFGKEKEYIEELKDIRHGGLGDVKIKRYLIDVLEEKNSHRFVDVVKSWLKIQKRLWKCCIRSLAAEKWQHKP